MKNSKKIKKLQKTSKNFKNLQNYKLIPYFLIQAQKFPRLFFKPNVNILKLHDLIPILRTLQIIVFQ